MSRNQELFFKVANGIEEEPDKYEQCDWYSDNYEYEFDEDGYEEKVYCGTTACIAGWAVCLSRESQVGELDHSTGDICWQSEGTEALGITAVEGEVLFGGGWSPQTGMSVPDALRKIGEGARILDVSSDAVRRLHKWTITEEDHSGY